MATTHKKQVRLPKTWMLELNLAKSVEELAKRRNRHQSHVLEAALRLAFMQPEAFEKEMNEPTHEWPSQIPAQTQA